MRTRIDDVCGSEKKGQRGATPGEPIGLKNTHEGNHVGLGIGIRNRAFFTTRKTEGLPRNLGTQLSRSTGHKNRERITRITGILPSIACMANARWLMSTRILGRRTAPFPPFLIPNPSRMVLPQDPSTKGQTALANARLRQRCPARRAGTRQRPRRASICGTRDCSRTSASRSSWVGAGVCSCACAHPPQQLSSACDRRSRLSHMSLLLAAPRVVLPHDPSTGAAGHSAACGKSPALRGQLT